MAWRDGAGKTKCVGLRSPMLIASSHAQIVAGWLVRGATAVFVQAVHPDAVEQIAIGCRRRAIVQRFGVSEDVGGNDVEILGSQAAQIIRVTAMVGATGGERERDQPVA